MLAKLNSELEDYKHVLDQVKYRVDWAKYQEMQKRKEEEALERERGENIVVVSIVLLHLFFNHFPNDKFKTLPNAKRLLTTILDLMKMVEIVPNGLKTLWEKGEITLYEQCLLFPQCFQDLNCRHVKPRACVGRSLLFNTQSRPLFQ